MNAWVLPGVLVAWTATCSWVSGRLAGFVCGGERRWPVRLLLALVLLPLLVIDELVAQPPFEALCRRLLAAPVHAPAGPLADTQSRLLPITPPPEPVPGFSVPVHAGRVLQVDTATGRAVTTSWTLRAGGGKLARLLAAGGDAAPLTFDGTCGPVPPR